MREYQGDIEFEGRYLTLLREPGRKKDTFEAPAVDALNDKYLITWPVLEGEPDWDNFRVFTFGR